MTCFSRILIAAAILTASFGPLARAGEYAHAPKDMTVTAVNPVRPAGMDDFVPYGSPCKVPFGRRFSKLFDDDLQVIVFVEAKPGTVQNGQCPHATVFTLGKDEYASAEYDFMLATRTRMKNELDAVSAEAKKRYEATGFKGEKLRMATLLDPDVIQQRFKLRIAQALVLEAAEAMRRDKELYHKLAATE